MMFISAKNLGIAALLTLYIVSAGFQCHESECMKNPRSETPGIYFKLKDNITGNDILAPGTDPRPVPDSIKLRDIRTGFSYSLLVGLGVNESIIYSQLYRRPTGIIDTLEFRFGNSLPDTLIVYTGIVDGWRGDECPLVKDAGITKVVLRSQVLIETSNDQAMFTLKK
jgi:hypothetical protein